MPLVSAGSPICRFNGPSGISTIAVLDSRGHFTCLSPRASELSPTFSDVSKPRLELSLTGRPPFLRFPNLSPSDDGTFLYYKPPTISSIQPTTGDARGGSALFISGSGFSGAQREATIACLVGSNRGTVRHRLSLGGV